jgi:hypothetical protein
MENPMPRLDLQIIDDGSIVQFLPETAAGAEWLEENVELDDYRWRGNALVVDHRFALDLIDGLRSDGLRCQVGWLH